MKSVKVREQFNKSSKNYNNVNSIEVFRNKLRLIKHVHCYSAVSHHDPDCGPPEASIADFVGHLENERVNLDKEAVVVIPNETYDGKCFLHNNVNIKY